MGRYSLSYSARHLSTAANSSGMPSPDTADTPTDCTWRWAKLCTWCTADSWPTMLMQVARQLNRAGHATNIDYLQVAVELVERQAEGARKAGGVGALPLQGCVEGLKVLQMKIAPARGGIQQDG